MYSMSQHPQPANGGLGGDFVDGSGTIDPAALNAPAAHLSSSSGITQASPRGIKRSRSPDTQDTYGGDDDDSKPRKRGRPPKSKVPESPVSHIHSDAQPVQTPDLASQGLPLPSPTQASPAQASPTKAGGRATVLKALPTVRDHTSDQLNPEGDEYIPREFDQSGERKIGPNGALLGGRTFRCKTFTVPKRGIKLFMLATECARVLGYRDSYLLFNKNRSLFKIIASQEEKDHLIHEEILPYSYRSRQIAIVTARSMYRQFGSRVVDGGRRVRDDYWEAKAIKQGFTEEDLAGEKRPGGARQRAAMESAGAVGHHQQHLYYMPEDGRAKAPVAENVVYVHDPHLPRSYGQVQRQRQDYAGQQQQQQQQQPQLYQDRTPAGLMELNAQAQSTNDYNRNIAQQRVARSKYLEDIWHRPHAPPSPDPVAEAALTAATSAAVTATTGDTRSSVGAPASGGVPHTASPAPAVDHPPPEQAYSQQPGPPSLMAQSPVRSMHPPMGPGQMPQRSPSVNAHQQQNYASYQNQLWAAQQAQPSPLAQHPGMRYPQHMASPSPHLQHSPMHAPPQLQHQSNSGSLHQSGIPPYGGMQSPAYPGMHQRQMYQPSPSPHPHQQYMQTTSSSQPGMQGWAPQQGQPGQQQPWGGF